MSGREDEIRQRAYEIWEREGRPEGREEQHWHQAVREMEGKQSAKGSGSQAAATPRKPKDADTSGGKRTDIAPESSAASARTFGKGRKEAESPAEDKSQNKSSGTGRGKPRSGLGSALPPGGTTPGGGPEAGTGSAGTGGGSARGPATGRKKKPGS